jgi:hypothetical protein
MRLPLTGRFPVIEQIRAMIISFGKTAKRTAGVGEGKFFLE